MPAKLFLVGVALLRLGAPLCFCLAAGAPFLGSALLRFGLASLPLFFGVLARTHLRRLALCFFRLASSLGFLAFPLVLGALESSGFFLSSALLRRNPGPVQCIADVHAKLFNGLANIGGMHIAVAQFAPVHVLALGN